MYTVAQFGRMAADPPRSRAFVEALRRSIRPGAVVVDLGAGAGFMSLWACKLGAARVHAIEPNPAHQVLRENAVKNGYADRIVVHPHLSTKVTLPERADVLVSDLRGALPLFGEHLPTIVDARTRLLAPGGVQIGQRDELMVGLLSSERTIARAMRGSTDEVFDLSAQRAAILDSEFGIPDEVGEEDLLSEEIVWATLDYTTLESPDVSGGATLVATRAATCHGLVLSFRATLCEGVAYATGLRNPRQVYGPTVLPWREPVDLDAGEKVSVELRARYAKEGYLWSWVTKVGEPVRKRFRQSNFHTFDLPDGRAVGGPR